MRNVVSYRTDFADFELLPNVIIMRAFEGISLGLDQVSTIVDLAGLVKGDQIGWIGDKVNSYSAEPVMVTHVLKACPKLCSWCNVIYGRKVADYSSMMKAVAPSGFPINCFDELPPAIEWTIEMTAQASLKKASSTRSSESS